MNVNDLAIFNLSRGSHESPEDGVCFMEAVAWMQGEEHSDTPKGACSILGRFGTKLNDKMPNKYRSLLNPMVLKMVGTVSKEHEQLRVEYLVRQIAKRVVPIVFEAAGLTKQAGYLRAIADDAPMQYIKTVCRTYANAANVASYASYATSYAANAVSAASYAASYTADAASYTASYAANAASDATGYAASYAASYAAAANAAKEDIWKEPVKILDEAINLGPHGGDFYPIHEVRLMHFKKSILMERAHEDV